MKTPTREILRRAFGKFNWAEPPSVTGDARTDTRAMLRPGHAGWIDPLREAMRAGLD